MKKCLKIVLINIVLLLTMLILLTNISLGNYTENGTIKSRNTLVTWAKQREGLQCCWWNNWIFRGGRKTLSLYE